MSARRQIEFRSDGLLIVRGESVYISEVYKQAFASVLRTEHTEPTVSRVEVYALDTFYVDATVHMPGVSLAVVAPVWKTVGSKLINLSGLHGDKPPVLFKRTRSDMDGVAGQAGRPGRPGGNFLGVGLEFEGHLHVAVSGGRGGDGQRGQDGIDGKLFQFAGHGGDGGVAGRGAKAGLADLVHLGSQDPSRIPQWVLDAEKGQDGRAGRKGNGGLRYFLREEMLGGTAEDGRSTYDLELPADPSLPLWDCVPGRTSTYLALNLKHPTLGERVQEFKKATEESLAFQKYGY